MRGRDQDMTRWLIVADDLTGAADAASAFARRGVTTEVTWRESPPTDAEVVSYDADSRRLSAASADAQHRSAARRLLTPDRQLFKKIDSTLRGQPAAEIAALCATLHELGRPGCGVLAPANPSMGRSTRDGRVFVHGQRLEDTETWLLDHTYADADLVTMATAAGLAAVKVSLAAVRAEPAVLQATLSEAVARAQRLAQATVVIADAESDDDLSRIAAAASGNVGLFIGTGGLASALARRLPERKRPPTHIPRNDAGAVIVMGSLSSASRAAARELQARLNVRHVCFAPETLLDESRAALRAREAARIAETLKAGDDVLVEISAGAKPDPDLGPSLARSLAECLWPAMWNVSGLFATGGEIASALLARWCVGGILLLDEVEAGISLGIIAIHDTRIPIVTKPGGFGDSGSLVRSLERLRTLRQSGTYP
jgi:D-threonate/D-erythronate kinase